MQKQINGYISNYLSPYLCAHRKDFSSQQVFVSLIGNWNKVLDEKGFGRAVLMELSKAFDSIKHDLLKDNFYAYGFIISKYGFSIIISVINDTEKMGLWQGFI